ncbi:hypothetical protein [Helicobacter sp. MIT 14-3879]|uniref:hypothetical protein n=1 Tax=Helicobacter sp. MIT 14-3879 TaxID=2040649 RepID=UPI000E1E662C|nr:hypothetical protein [Helicobacter sp. MIT 14-3879]RDU65595.1 hypothetical protein CQA44_01045 [Helicobacter sp. MIT 14-3879]
MTTKKNALALILLALFFGYINAASFDDNLTSLIEKETQTKVKIISTNDLKATKDLKFVIVEIIDNAQRIPMFATKDGKMIIGLSNMFFASEKADEDIIAKASAEAMSHNENSQQMAAGKLIDGLKPEQYITLNSKAKNPKTYFIVADPNCGYCKEEFRNIDEKLKTHNVNIVMVGILGEDSLKKASYAMDNINSKMNEKDKLNKLKEVFSNNFKAPSNIDTTKVKNTTESLFKSGVIRGVPFIYEAK